MVQQVNSVEAACFQSRDEAERAEAFVGASAVFWIAVDPQAVGHGGLGTEDLIGRGAGLGHQRHRSADMRGDRAYMRQMPDRVADAGQRLDDRRFHGVLVRP